MDSVEAKVSRWFQRCEESVASSYDLDNCRINALTTIRRTDLSSFPDRDGVNEYYDDAVRIAREISKPDENRSVRIDN